MIRAIVNALLPFLAPFLVFLLWAAARGLWARRHGAQRPAVERGAYFWLALSGCVCAMIAMGAAALTKTGGGTPGDVYTAPRLENGAVIPGGFSD